ncbi:hypothetical protein CAter282_3766 [Collimonas arenae]|uniref:Uncharacterized protein n=1 Tax=Collimonas arenae TaxID=279058 RepID=A0A127QN45_9BURK|nr:hypothetical protein CAter282_3766 [Collimonas arenae]
MQFKNVNRNYYFSRQVEGPSIAFAPIVGPKTKSHFYEWRGA